MFLDKEIYKEECEKLSIKLYEHGKVEIQDIKIFEEYSQYINFVLYPLIDLFKIGQYPDQINNRIKDHFIKFNYDNPYWNGVISFIEFPVNKSNVYYLKFEFETIETLILELSFMV